MRCGCGLMVLSPTSNARSGIAVAAIVKRASAASSTKASTAVGTLVLKKRLVLNAPWKHLMGTFRGKKCREVNKRLNTF
jgi:hypothetical protein